MRIIATLVLLAATAAYVLLHPPADLAAGHGVLAACPERFGDWNGSKILINIRPTGLGVLSRESLSGTREF